MLIQIQTYLIIIINKEVIIMNISSSRKKTIKKIAKPPLKGDEPEINVERHHEAENFIEGIIDAIHKTIPPKQIKPHGEPLDNIIRGIISAVASGDPAITKTAENIGFECEKCGWCCENIQNIIVHKKEREKIIKKLGAKEKKNFKRPNYKDVRFNLMETIKLGVYEQLGVVPTDKELRILAKQNFEITYRDIYMLKQEAPCKYYDSNNKKCTIYDIKPLICSKFPLNNDQVYFIPECRGYATYIKEMAISLITDL